jgi:hypothetical protein
MMKPDAKIKLPFVEIFMALFVGFGCLVIVLLFANISRPRQTTSGVVTAALTVIPAPTETPAPRTPLPVTPTLGADAPLGPAAGVLVVGSFVQINGTEGEGLRVREGPGLGYEPLFLALESEVFKIIDGPQRADEYTWWRLAAPFDESLNGWSVENYMLPVDEP